MPILDTALSSQAVVSRFFASVYRWMAGALLISALVAWQTASSAAFLSYIMAHSGIFFLIVIVQLACVIALAGWAQKMSYPVAVIT
ncbi:hypothetical protein JXA05_01165, partial [Candidatus Peregrinibacteria bacterium]|nr:hypothetical protein [Candidatus Peregrinibacteria bacterium]